jgi:hypothetical protein
MKTKTKSDWMAWLACLAFTAASVQAQDWTNRVQTLVRMAYMGKAVSNELARIAGDPARPAEVRQAAQAALQESRPGTNDLASLESFLSGWTMTNAPLVDLALIAQMDAILDYGASAVSIMEADAADTNSPAWYGAVLGHMLENMNTAP